MTKGFFNPLDPQLKPAIQRLSKTLKSRNVQQLETTVEILERRIGEDRFSEIVGQLHFGNTIADITPEDVQFFWDWIISKLKVAGIWEDAKTHAVNLIVQDFLENGLSFGKDFSFHADGGLLLSEAGTEVFLSHVPEDCRESFQTQYFQSIEQPTDLRTIARNVGVHPEYFDRAIDKAKTRLEQYLKADDGYFVLSYLDQFLTGTETKFPELKPFFGVKLLASLGMGQGTTLDRIAGQPEVYSVPDDEITARKPLAALWVDIISSADDRVEIKAEGDDILLSKAAIKTLASVWESDPENNAMPLRELIGHMEAMENSR